MNTIQHNKDSKINLILTFGGKTSEHYYELATKDIYDHYDKSLFNLYIIGVAIKTGQFYYFPDNSFLKIDYVDNDLNQIDGKKLCCIRKNKLNKPVIAIDDDEHTEIEIDCLINDVATFSEKESLLEGLFSALDIKYIGSKYSELVISRNKTFQKLITQHYGIAVPKFISFQRSNVIDYNTCVETLGLPFFLKNNFSVASNGVYKIKSEIDFKMAMRSFFDTGASGLVEQAINCREIMVAVNRDLDGNIIIAEKIGEVITSENHEFQTRIAKYFSNDTKHIFDVKFEDNVREDLYRVSKKLFEVFECNDRARVDLFIDKDSGDILFNELTLEPYFCKDGIYAMLWEGSGVSYTQLITNLILNAING